MRTFRDPTYLIALAALIGLLVASVVLALTYSSAAGGAPVAAVAPTPVPTPAPTAIPTPTLAQVLLDSRRALDLQQDATALEAFRASRGAYPTSENNFMTFCNFAFDPGCQLALVTKKISGGDGTYPYWYRSDGAAFTLFAQVETQPADNGCPAAVPPLLTGVPLLCINSKQGAP